MMVEIPNVIPKVIPKIISAKAKNKPIHIAINASGVKGWAEDNKKDMPQAIAKHLELLDTLIDLQLKHDQQVLTINIPEVADMVDDIKDFFNHLLNDERVHENQMRIFIIGQWYDLDSELTDVFKELMEKTKKYDKHFTAFCVNYDGQEEILGSIRLIVRKILAEKLKEEDLSNEIIKENLYSSYFPPPEIIIENGWKYSGMLIWDSKDALIYYTREAWLDFDKKDYEKAISFYNKEKGEEKK